MPKYSDEIYGINKPGHRNHYISEHELQQIESMVSSTVSMLTHQMKVNKQEYEQNLKEIQAENTRLKQELEQYKSQHAHGLFKQLHEVEAELKAEYAQKLSGLETEKQNNEKALVQLGELIVKNSVKELELSSTKNELEKVRSQIDQLKSTVKQLLGSVNI